MPAEFDREAAFREWMAVAMPNLGPDGTAFVRIIWAAAARAARETIPGVTPMRRRALERYRADQYHSSSSGSGQETADLKTLAFWLSELAADPAARTGGT